LESRIQKAETQLLAPFQVSIEKLNQVMHTLMQNGVEDGDLYFQSVQSESWSLEESIIKSGSFDVETGVGVRAIVGEKTGFAYSDDLSLPALIEAAKAARSISHAGETANLITLKAVQPQTIQYDDLNPILSLTTPEKIQLLRTVDECARNQDDRVKQVNASLAGVYEVILVLGRDGTLAADFRPLIRLSVDVLVEEKGRREHGSAGGGGRYGFDTFLKHHSAEHFAKEAVRQALVNLEAIPAPAGTMTVVLGSGWPGVLLHEAVGHGLEGDFNRRGVSAFSGKIGQKVASPLCTVVDDGTLSQRRGSLTVDDEGTPTQHNVLIEKGILKGYMQDKLNARLMKMKPTGNGRRESYASLPMPRMTNTYMLPGDSDPADIIASVKKGIYAVHFGGGSVDITSGKFVFAASEAYLIENGKVTTPVKGASLIGNGPEAMGQISMVGNDLALDEGIGVCGKEGQSVPVGVGQPTLKLDAMTVGGTAHG